MSDFTGYVIFVLCLLIYVFWGHAWLMGKLVSFNRKATIGMRDVQIKQIKRLIKAYSIRSEELFDE